MAVNWSRVVVDLLHPTQREILTRCERQSRSPNQIAKALGVPLGAVSYHVRTLAEKGLLTCVHTEPRRGAIEHFYLLTPSYGTRRRNGNVPSVDTDA